ncbi:MAG TPA: ORF6N domain-containing protein [Paludibacter sp.]
MQLQNIQSKIYEIRDQKVMLDFDLAAMYEVETRALKQAVKRNADRFPDDFMFQLSKVEWQELITICDNLPETIKYSPATPYAFTEQGVAMLSSVLKSKKALQVNIAIMRAFVFIRQYALTHKDLTEKIKELETLYDKQFADVYDAINYLLQKDKQQTEQRVRKRIGFNVENPE